MAKSLRCKEWLLLRSVVSDHILLQIIYKAEAIHTQSMAIKNASLANCSWLLQVSASLRISCEDLQNHCMVAVGKC